MPFIDWADAEEMVGLLIEYVQDELSESSADAGRRQFLRQLIQDLQRLDAGFHELPASERARALRRLDALSHTEFHNDPVVAHVEDCAQELDQIGGEPATLGGNYHALAPMPAGRGRRRR